MTAPSIKVYQGDFDTTQQDILEAIYRLYVEDSEPVTVDNVETRVNVTRTAVHRRMLALERDGYLWRNQAGKYGRWFLSHRGLKQVSPNPAKGGYEYRRFKFLTELAGQAKDNVLSL